MFSIIIQGVISRNKFKATIKKFIFLLNIKYLYVNKSNLEIIKIDYLLLFTNNFLFKHLYQCFK